MYHLQEKLETAIRETLKDEHGAGSDLSLARDIPGPWMHVEGNLDVQHLASHIIETIGIEYEYRLARRWRDEADFHVIGPWYPDLPEAQEALDMAVESNVRHNTGTEFKLVKRIAAGKTEDL
jgi:hypothetical protein